MRFLFTAILISIALLPTSSYCASNQSIGYPGNGLPILSKDKPIKELNDAFNGSFSKHSDFQTSKDGVIFTEIKETFTSSPNISINKSNLTIKQSLTVEKGKITIKFGSVEFSIEPKGAVINENGKLVRRVDFQTKAIQINRGYGFDNKIGTIAYLCSAGGCLGGEVNIDFPASTSLTITAGSSGSLGQWFWGRGSK
jgi:hypothetical protein